MRKNLLIYTENIHDSLTRNILNLIDVKKYNVFIITQKKKISRLQKITKSDNLNYIEIEEIYPIKAKSFKRVFNSIKTHKKIKKIINEKKIDIFLVLEIYDSLLKYFLSFNSQYILNKILTIHNIHDYFEVEKLLMERYNLKKVKNYQKK